ncbi:hypothetical protein [Herpetosiphon gulosus]|uniref:Uncharacterized protein n=1 Tax=Herpetosiphon gulosus TaxID=1973496 RepID=A0ABP9X0G7_9CHLR
MEIIPQISHAMHTLLTTTTEAIAAAQQYGKHPDRAECCPSTLVQTLVYDHLAQSTATVEQLAQMACCIGVDVSPQAIDQRVTMATADLLHQLVLASIQPVITTHPVALTILQRVASVRVHDRLARCAHPHLARLWECNDGRQSHAQMWHPT